MRAIIKEIIDAIPTMSHDERTIIIENLKSIDSYDKIIDIIENHIESSHKCPYCGSNHLHKHGKSAGLERYMLLNQKTYLMLTFKTKLDLLEKEVMVT